MEVQLDFSNYDGFLVLGEFDLGHVPRLPCGGCRVRITSPPHRLKLQFRSMPNGKTGGPAVFRRYWAPLLPRGGRVKQIPASPDDSCGYQVVPGIWSAKWPFPARNGHSLADRLNYENGLQNRVCQWVLPLKSRPTPSKLIWSEPAKSCPGAS